jgi:hypothetical protein
MSASIDKRHTVRPRTIICSILAASLLGCATQGQFYKDPQSLSDAQVCRLWVQASGDFFKDVDAEASRRNLDYGECQAKVQQQNLGIAAALLIGIAAAAAARGGGGGGYATPAQPAAANDFDWDWDQFYNQGGQLVWACRGVQTGRFAPNYHCAGKPMTDWRWPGK